MGKCKLKLQEDITTNQVGWGNFFKKRLITPSIGKTSKMSLLLVRL